MYHEMHEPIPLIRSTTILHQTFSPIIESDVVGLALILLRRASLTIINSGRRLLLCRFYAVFDAAFD